MFSLKSATRRTMTVLLAATMATSIFVGCSKQEDELPVETFETNEITDILLPGIEEVEDTNDFSIKYKYWYDNPDVEASSTVVNASADDIIDTFPGINSINIYKDSEDNQYLISGRTQVYLADGKIAAKDLYSLLRQEGTGYRYYFALPDTAANLLAVFNERLGSVNGSQPTTYTERVEGDAGHDTELDELGIYDIFINNIETGIQFSSDEQLINISSILSSFMLGAYETVDDVQTLHLYTACDKIDIEFTDEGGLLTLSYSTGEKKDCVGSDEVQVTDSAVRMSLEAIQRYLGYDVEFYDDFINIVTDNKDIFTFCR